MRARLAIRLGAAAIVLAAAGVAAAVIVHRMAMTGESEQVFEPWDRLGGEPWLRANLRNARMVAPDRPHDRGQVLLRRAGDQDALTRTRSFRLNTNAQRLRGRTDVGRKEPGTTRIVSLGESVAHGWGLDDDEAYPPQLQRILGERGHDVEVLNAGVPSLGPSTMALWCQVVGPELELDLLLWVRRPFGGNSMARDVQRCRDAIGVPVVVLLPPVSTFDLYGSRVGEQEARQVQASMPGLPVHDLTAGMRAAQQGRPGALLERRDGQLVVYDQVSGKVWLTFDQGPGQDKLPAQVYALFEDNPDLREPLFFDEGHPDAEGAVIMAGLVADAVEPHLP